MVLGELVAFLAMAMGPGPAERIVDADVFQGAKASAPIAKTARQQNAGGSDGKGLCVVAALVAVLRDQGEPEMADWLWKTARSRPGGYWPERLDALLRECQKAHPDKTLEWATCRGGDWREFAKRWTATGRALGATYARGGRYGGPISHMVALEHYGPDQCLFMDNNFVDDPMGPRSWTSEPEASARVEGGGGPRLVGLATDGPGGPDEQGPAGPALALGLLLALAARLARRKAWADGL